MAVLDLGNLSKTYDNGEQPAVKGISFTVTEGELMVLLGPSGCGKSSVLRMIAGLESITSGTVSIDGRVVNEVPARDRDIAMVFQSYALYPHMSAYDNIAFGLRRRGLPKREIDQRIQNAAAKLGLTPVLQRKPHALSGGERQRVALGRAMVREPKVFLFDEPLSNLDAALRSATRDELIRQHNELRITTLYVTHDQVEAMTMGDRICLMQRGEVVQIGPPLEVYRNPVDTFVARFLGNPPMNLLCGALEVESERLLVRFSGARLSLPGQVPPQLAAYAGREVTVGVRPEDLYETSAPLPVGRTAELRARVVMVERLGAESLLMLSLDGSGEPLIARVGRNTAIKRDDLMTVMVDTAAIHFFDPTTARAIAWEHELNPKDTEIRVAT
jgi:multiple sugar transport system ATP-binding protein